MKRLVLITAVVVVVLVAAGLAVYSWYWYSGPIPRNCAPGAVYDLRGFEAQLDGFLARYADPGVAQDPTDLRGAFSIDAGGSTDLYGATDVAYVLWISDQLDDRTTAEGREEWAGVINGFQNPATGLFDRGNDSGESVTHATAFATAALRLLGQYPAQAHLWAEERFASRVTTEAWLDTFGWNQIWSGSHEVGAIAAVLDAPEGIDLPSDWLEEAMAAVDGRIDERTGYWKNGILDGVFRRANTIDLGGAAHFWWIYNRVGRTIPYPRKAIVGILRTQKPSGIWGTRLFNAPIPQGIDFDAINGYRLAYRALSPTERMEVRDEIIESVDRYACAVALHLTPDGALLDLYHSTHKLVGLMNALAETNALCDDLGIPRRFLFEGEWRPALDVVTWQ
jgi:hypothetical protein